MRSSLRFWKLESFRLVFRSRSKYDGWHVSGNRFVRPGHGRSRRGIVGPARKCVCWFLDGERTRMAALRVLIESISPVLELRSRSASGSSNLRLTNH
jgi:hypothetical protein